MSRSVYLPSCSMCALKRIIDRELHQTDGPRAIPAIRIGERNRELVAIGHSPRHLLAGRERHRDLRWRRRFGVPARARVEHALKQGETLQPLGDAREVASSRMTLRARGVEVALASLDVAGLKIGNVNGAPPAGQCGLPFLIVNKRDGREQVELAEVEGRHSLVDAAVAHDWPELVTANVLGNDGATGEIGTRLAAHGIAPVTEAALRDKDLLPRFHLLRRIRLSRRLTGRSLACSSRCLRSGRQAEAAAEQQCHGHVQAGSNA